MRVQKALRILLSFLLLLLAASATSWREWMSMNNTHDYLICLKERMPAASELECSAIEQFLSEDLPPSYRHFLKTINGGSFRNCLINMWGVESNGVRPVPAWQVLEALRTLSPKKIGGPLSLYDDSDSMRTLYAGEHKLLKIGYTIDSNLIYLGLSDDVYGQVYLKTSLLPVLVNGIYKQFESEWFLLGEDFDSFLARLEVAGK